MLKNLIILLSLSLFCFSQEDAVAMKGVKIKLFPEVEAVKAGEVFTIAIFIQHFDGFHTYWKNPGKVGVATTMDWEMPPGFKVINIDWQVPQRSKMLMYNCHGYKEDTYLLVNIKAPAKIPESFTISATVGGMSCSSKTCCFVGYAKADIALKSADKTVLIPENHQRIEAARQRIPKLKPGSQQSFSMNDDYLTVKLKNIKTDKSLNEQTYFFPEQNFYDTEVKQLFSIEKGQLQVKLKLNQIADKNLKKISGFLYSDKGWDKPSEKYLRVEASLTSE